MALLAPAYDLFLPAGWRPTGERHTVVIERGQSLHDIAHELQRVGVIRSQAGFLVLARMMQLDRSVKAGQYSFKVGITVPALLRALDRGMFGLNLITIPEGLMVNETASLIQRQVGIRAVALDSLARDPALLDSLQVSAPSLEGWLAPDSYEWLPGTSPEVVLRTMVARTRERVQRATAGYDSLPLGMNTHEVLTLASIVESESRAEDERPRIARVYLNRLDRGMLLQADPTVGYALGRGPRSRLTFKDLRVVSSYNTYRHEGLPPGPICSPGLSAIEAVMHATPGTKDLYFVANGQGRHIFAPTYQQHLANISYVRGRKAAVEAAATREGAGTALPDSGPAGPASVRTAPIAGAGGRAGAAASAARPAGTGLKPAAGVGAPLTPIRLAPAGSATEPRPHTTATGALAEETPAPAGTPLKGLVAPAGSPGSKPSIQPAATTPSGDTPVRSPETRPARTAGDSAAKATSRPAGPKPSSSAGAKPPARPGATATDSTARKPAAPKLSKPSQAAADTSKRVTPVKKPAKPATASADTSAKQ
jgi:UPF0755 protein